MMNKKIKWMAVIVLLLAIVCNVVACGGETEEIPPMDFYPPTEPAPPLPSSEITKINFAERFGDYLSGRYVVEVIATKELIQFRCIIGDALREQEEEITRNFECGQSAWNELMAVLNDNHVNTWKSQGYYLNQFYGQGPGIFMEWPEVEFVKEGDFFNITDINSVCSQAIPPYYYGIDQNEKKFRSDYHGSFELYTNDESSYLWRAYDSYGVPKEYNRFRKEFWDVIVGYTGIPDWRLELGDWGRENLYKKYPYMLQEGQERQIRYFSLVENYGYKENGFVLAVALVYDGGEQSILYQSRFQGKIYSVGKSGKPVFYKEKRPTATNRVNTVSEVPKIPEGLSEIIERYKVENWESETSGTEYVRQGEFFNVENARQLKDKNEQVLRSGYGALIHVIYTDGDHVEIQLENGQLPEAYNDFRDELWDYMIPYMDERKAEGEQIVDWRDMLDQWGKE